MLGPVPLPTPGRPLGTSRGGEDDEAAEALELKLSQETLGGAALAKRANPHAMVERALILELGEQDGAVALRLERREELVEEGERLESTRSVAHPR